MLEKNERASACFHGTNYTIITFFRVSPPLAPQCYVSHSVCLASLLQVFLQGPVDWETFESIDFSCSWQQIILVHSVVNLPVAGIILQYLNSAPEKKKSVCVLHFKKVQKTHYFHCQCFMPNASVHNSFFLLYSISSTINVGMLLWQIRFG